MNTATAANQFPEIPLPADLPDLSPLCDESYKNDVCPVFRAYIGARIIELWIDHEDPEQRELLGRPRFVFAIHSTSDGETLDTRISCASGETLAEIIGAQTMAEYIASHTAQTLDELTATYQQWLRGNNLPQMCAMELLHTDMLDKYQRAWATSFSAAWDANA